MLGVCFIFMGWIVLSGQVLGFLATGKWLSLNPQTSSVMLAHLGVKLYGWQTTLLQWVEFPPLSVTFFVLGGIAVWAGFALITSTEAVVRRPRMPDE